MIDCDSGICLGNSHKPADIEVHCRGCTVRNNFVVRCPENGILADYTRDCKIVHNTIHDPAARLKRLIRLVHDNDGLVVANNLLSGPPMRVETTSPIDARGNVTGDFTAAFPRRRHGRPAPGTQRARGCRRRRAAARRAPRHRRPAARWPAGRGRRRMGWSASQWIRPAAVNGKDVQARVSDPAGAFDRRSP